MNKEQLLLIYIDYICDLKMLIIKKQKIPADLIVEIRQLQYIINNYDSLLRLIIQLGKKKSCEKLYSKDKYFKQFSKDYFKPVNQLEENRVR